jgi:hypothetical protein
MSKYLVNKFLFTIDRDPELVERYREDPRGTVAWWEAGQSGLILNATAADASTWLEFTEPEREALAAHDYVALFGLGAHPFLTLTLFIAMFERDHAEPLGFQLDYARRLGHVSRPYPDIAT